jgi:hypothetical protein
MQRLCERPGCSEVASVAYGMRAEDLVFWLDVLLDPDPDGGGRGVLCRRHADSMVVPRNWTLDDQRDPDLHLFRPPPRNGAAGRRISRRRTGARPGEQLALSVDGGTVPPLETTTDGSGAGGAKSGGAVSAEAPGAVAADVTAPAGEPWIPTFDASDDLDGLLAARSPLLARAFRGTDRSRR